MKNKIHYSLESRRDLDDIWDYIVSELQNRSAAERVTNRIMDAVEHLDKTLDFLVVCRIVFVEVADVQDDFRHLVDRVVAALGRGAVAGNTVHVDADFHSAAMTAIDAAVGRLGGDNESKISCTSCIWNTNTIAVIPIRFSGKVWCG